MSTSAGCLVLVDANQIPTRVVSLHTLLSIADVWVSSSNPLRERYSSEDTLPVSHREVEMAFSDASSVAISVIAINCSSEVAAQTVAASPDTYWIVVDQERRYLGLLDKAKLLATVVTRQTSGAEPSKAEALLSADSGQSEEVDLEPGDVTPSQQISQSNAALLTYLGHELKTPLTSLLGLSSLLRTGRLGGMNARQTRYVALIQQHCRRLAVLVNTLIDLGRVDSGYLQLMPHIVDLSAVWREAYSQAALRLGLENAQVPTIPYLLRRDAATITLVADPLRLQQMLTCLMQSTLATRATDKHDGTAIPLDLETWDNWLAFIAHEIDEVSYQERFLREIAQLPFPTISTASMQISSVAGHWLEWLLVRKLAQLHGGDLVLMAHADHSICPTLLIPMTPTPAREKQFLLFITAATIAPLKTIQQQIAPFDYRLLITSQIMDALEISSHVPLAAILVLIEGPQSIQDLGQLKMHVEPHRTLLVALVPPRWSALMGELPADREILWPGGDLGNVLSQPPSTVRAPNRLTVLYLKETLSESLPSSPQQASIGQLPQIFQDFGCRVLEVDDVDQAILLQRVWQPDVAVLDPEVANPTAYLETLSQSPELTQLPLITLTMGATQAAHAFESLKVFPCLLWEVPQDTPETNELMAAWLIQVIQVAVGQ